VNRLVEIAKAWIIAANPEPEQKLLAETRASVCDLCEHRIYAKILDMHVCDLCGCPLNKKIFSPAGPNACPDKRWEK
jgi:hypothetical protein